MPRLTKCVISVKAALALRKHSLALDEFHCPKCGELVDAHKAGEGPTGIKSAAHFEHRVGNAACPYSHSHRKAAII